MTLFEISKIIVGPLWLFYQLSHGRACKRDGKCVLLRNSQRQGEVPVRLRPKKNTAVRRAPNDHVWSLEEVIRSLNLILKHTTEPALPCTTSRPSPWRSEAFGPKCSPGRLQSSYIPFIPTVCWSSFCCYFLLVSGGDWTLTQNIRTTEIVSLSFPWCFYLIIWPISFAGRR